MTPRRRSAALAAAALVGLLLAATPVTELPRRAAVLARSASRELAVRRLHGSGAAFDRRFFSFLENVRRSLPADAPGVAVAGAPDADPYVYLAAYWLAPVPVRFGRERPPAGWLLATYGREPRGVGPLRARLPEGFLEGPLP